MPDAALTGRSRTLRCSNCMTKWKVPALEMYRQEPAPEPAPAEPALDAAGTLGDTAVMQEPEPGAAKDEAMAGEAVAPVSMLRASREIPAQVAPSPRRGLAISMLVVLLIIAAMLAEHRPIGNFWPPSLRLFNALGLK